MAEPHSAAPSTARRYALSFAPSPGTLGWLAGSHWLGRCAAQLQPLQQLDIAGVAADDLHRLALIVRRELGQGRHLDHATADRPLSDDRPAVAQLEHAGGRDLIAGRHAGNHGDLIAAGRAQLHELLAHADQRPDIAAHKAALVAYRARYGSQPE